MTNFEIMEGLDHRGSPTSVSGEWRDLRGSENDIPHRKASRVSLINEIMDKIVSTHITPINKTPI